MQHQAKWKNWPVLVLGICFVGVLLYLSVVLNNHKLISDYTTEIAGAITAIIISIATYDEWERRQERKRYMPPEGQGIQRIKDEIIQLIYQFDYMLDNRFTSIKTKTGQNTVGLARYRIQAAKHSAERKLLTKQQLNSAMVRLKESKLDGLSYVEAELLINRVHQAVERIDGTIATYGYSFTPEIHQQSLKLRERLEQTITGNKDLFDIWLAARYSKKASSKISRASKKAIAELIQNLIHIAKSANSLKARA